MTYHFETEVTKSLERLLNTETDYNVIVQIGEEPNFKEFHVHSNILRCRSEHFNNLFYDGEIEKRDKKYIIYKPNISPQAFDVILKYLYVGYVDLTDKTGTELLNIIIASDELNLENLTKLTKDFIIEHYQLLQGDPVGTLQTVFNNKSLNDLREYCLEKICPEPEILFNSNKFTQISVQLLETILKREDLNMDEIEIWENIVRWGLAQEHNFNEDVSQWDKDDILTFKRIICRFIPLIRFYDISPKDYMIKIKPYEEVLSKEFRDDLLNYYMIPEYIPKLNNLTSRNVKDSKSVIINQKHIALFTNWIGRREKNKTASYKFDLLYRASRDGNTAIEFHEKCDNRRATITIIKLRDSEGIVGGYNPLEWDSSNGSFKRTKDSFIFSFTNRTDLETAKIGYSNGDKNSIICYPDYGPIFGYNNLYLHNGTWRSNPDIEPCSYPKIDDLSKLLDKIRSLNVRTSIKALAPK
ncbi:BTB/POZ domain-containing protein [Rhizophagus clarus]|uniref:BTB/POZ domain-containing protein n=1 Tax=Rhizophagus clarus TaxID=94130 RepID=A0A8H3QJ29_9GLOM|nr:BTB/POZ domain-containing protein [Rhizophagus clarus]